MAAQPKPQQTENVDTDLLDPPAVDVALGNEPAFASPARSLQQQLETEVSVRPTRYAPRLVFGTLIVFCLSVWWALYLLASFVSRTWT